MQKVPASNQVRQLTDTLASKLVERLDAARRIEQLDEEIAAIRNLLAGIGLGRELQKELDAEAKPADEAPTS